MLNRATARPSRAEGRTETETGRPPSLLITPAYKIFQAIFVDATSSKAPFRGGSRRNAVRRQQVIYSLPSELLEVFTAWQGQLRE